MKNNCVLLSVSLFGFKHTKIAYELLFKYIFIKSFPKVCERFSWESAGVNAYVSYLFFCLLQKSKCISRYSNNHIN